MIEKINEFLERVGMFWLLPFFIIFIEILNGSILMVSEGFSTTLVIHFLVWGFFAFVFYKVTLLILDGSFKVKIQINLKKEELKEDETYFEIDIKS